MEWRRGRVVAVTAAFALAATVGFAPAASADPTALRMYEATVDAEQLEELTTGGYDVASAEPVGDRFEVDLVLTGEERDELAKQGFDLTLLRDRKGRTVTKRAAAQAENGFQVWRDYDGRDGIRAELYRFAQRHKKIAQLHVLGRTHEGREILAIRLTEKPRKTRVGSRPAVLYQGTTHAREWISTEVTRRLMHSFADSYRGPKSNRELLENRELWFIPVVNPDGYQYTHDTERLWRKNLRDNNGDGQIAVGDGVDLNRNYPEHWNWDDEGSSGEPTSDTYRGPSAGSEPETRANMRLFNRVDFAFAVSYHSYGPLLIYPEGWQMHTPTRDDPIYVALSGNDKNPAIPGFNPGLGTELYATNGEFTDWAHSERDSLSWTPELNEGCEGCGFVFPDNEAQVQQEFEINQPFALDLARSARDPDDPQSHLGNTTEPFYLETVSAEPRRAGNPLSDFRFNYSYGDPQPVEILAKRSLGRVRVHYRINGGAEQTAPTSKWQGGETYGESYDTYYRQMRGEVTGTQPGDEVEVWFEGGGERSDSFTYSAVAESDAEALIVAAEDYTGISETEPYGSNTAPNYLSYFEQALSDNNISHEVYDVDGRGRVAPDHLGVLSHFDTVVWYTANDVVTREPGMVAGTASRLALDEQLEMRSYLNEGGKLLYNGQYAGFQYAFGYAIDPVANAPCGAGDPEVDARCEALSDDFLQYYLGSYIYNDEGGTVNGEPVPIAGTGDPFAGTGWSLNGADSADNQVHTASLLSTSSLLPESEYPQFASDAPAGWETGAGGAFEPFDGSRYMYSHRADVSYKRLTRTIDLTGVSEADAPTLNFRASYDTEPAWDFFFVEAHTADQDNWTTLPDANGHTQADVGDSCAEGWHELHPWLERYQGADCSGANATTGGEWHAASGRSAGWEPWSIDLSDYAGQRVEVSISYASDWQIQGLGAFVDQIEVSTGEGSTSFEDDDVPMDGWAIAGPPEGSGPSPNDWERLGSVAFEEGAAVSTDDTLYFGFGLEGIAGADQRADVMGRSMDYLMGE